MKHSTVRLVAVVLACALVVVPSVTSSHRLSLIGSLNTISTVASTVPSNGDINPYGVAVVPTTTGESTRGDILVSNFNNGGNLQGTGTTIVEIASGGHSRLFAQIHSNDLAGSCAGRVGLTTALVVLRKGWVIAGSLPTADGMSATSKPGCLIVLNSRGHFVETIAGAMIKGPWDMTAFDGGEWAALFVTNVLNGTVAGSPNVVQRGTVVRVVLSVPDQAEKDDLPAVQSQIVIGSGFGERTDPGALVVGPTGVSLGNDGTLYVADTLANRIADIPNALVRRTSAGIGRTISVNGALNGPLGLAVAPNGDILVANANDGNLVETTPAGVQIATKTVDTAGAGTLFGLAIAPATEAVYFVDDGTNTLNLLH
jgi:hypothetical protein